MNRFQRIQKQGRRIVSRLGFAMALSTAVVIQTPAAKADGVTTIQDHIEGLVSTKGFDIRDPMSTFGHVFSTLGDKVKVYPTENYFYFQFYKDGISYSGNIRLDALDRDKGIANFAYFTTYNRWNAELINKFKQITKKDGLAIKKLDPLNYQLTYKGKTVVFALNDLRNVKPPIGKISSDEQYIGPVYDESAIQFYLVYNSKLKGFHYVLNRKDGFPDVLTPARSNKNILIGHRTGFAFYRDPFRDRLILIGIYNGNSMVNNYFDGPFDQLPDNFIKGETLRAALIDQTPSLKGEIDRWGNTGNGQSRVLITPYMHYNMEWELGIVEDCIAAGAADDQANFYRCMDADTLSKTAAAAANDTASDEPVENGTDNSEPSAVEGASKNEGKGTDTKTAEGTGPAKEAPSKEGEKSGVETETTKPKDAKD